MPICIAELIIACIVHCWKKCVYSVQMKQYPSKERKVHSILYYQSWVFCDSINNRQVIQELRVPVTWKKKPLLAAYEHTHTYKRLHNELDLPLWPWPLWNRRIMMGWSSGGGGGEHVKKQTRSTSSESWTRSSKWPRQKERKKKVRQLPWASSSSPSSECRTLASRTDAPHHVRNPWCATTK